MLRIAYDVVKPIWSFHVCTEAEKYFQTPCLRACNHYVSLCGIVFKVRSPQIIADQLIVNVSQSC